MRGLTAEYFNTLKQNGNNINDFDQIKQLLSGPEKDDYFLGIRNDYLSLYYKGMSIAKIEKKSKEFKYTMSNYYRSAVINYAKKAMPSQVFWNKTNLDKLKTKIKDHVFGYHKGNHSLKLEKVCQQWIMNQNNSAESSEWYYVDMEYVFDQTPVGQKGKTSHPYGRTDMIAIRKKANVDNIHEVAFVELKVGSGAYAGGYIVGDTEEKKDEQRQLFKILKDDNGEGIHDTRLDKIKLGSGIVSHIADFIRLFAQTDFYSNYIRKELINILTLHKEFGLIDKNSALANISDINMLSTKPDFYIVSYGSVPQLDKRAICEKAQHNFVEEHVKKMKSTFYKYLYTSKYCAKNIFREVDIKDIIEIQSKFNDFCKTDDESLECIQHIKEEPFKIIFKFINPNDRQGRQDAWNCLN